LRPMFRTRRWRRTYVALGVSIVGIPAPAVALAVGQADAQSAMQVDLNRHQLALGQAVVVSGNASSADAGQTVQLQFARTGARSWQSLRSATVHSDGRFRFVARLKRSGRVRVVTATALTTDRATVLLAPGAASTGAAAASVPVHVSVASRLDVPARAVNALAGQSVDIRGRLLPGLAGRRVRLQGRGAGGGWQTLATSGTGAQGGFDLRYAPGATGHERLRVRFAGDRLNAWSGAPAGELTVYRQDVASWYNDAGSTACGFHAYFGVANRTLPCGTSVTFGYGGRTVTAVVDDRGPFVGGRNWDLNQNTAAALGFGGVGVVSTSQ
jgi:rare lipoprotein A